MEVRFQVVTRLRGEQMREEGDERRRLNLGEVQCATLDLDELFPSLTETDMTEKEETTRNILGETTLHAFSSQTHSIYHAHKHTQTKPKH